MFSCIWDRDIPSMVTQLTETVHSHSHPPFEHPPSSIRGNFNVPSFSHVHSPLSSRCSPYPHGMYRASAPMFVRNAPRKNIHVLARGVAHITTVVAIRSQSLRIYHPYDASHTRIAVQFSVECTYPSAECIAAVQRVLLTDEHTSQWERR